MRNGSRASTAHFQRYVDDGRLAGWQMAISRGGQLAHLVVGRASRRRGRAADHRDTIWRIYSMTKPITSVAALMLWEEGCFELKDPVSRFLPEFADAEGVALRLGDDAGARPDDRTDADVAPDDPHLRAHLRVPVRASRRRAVPQRRVRVGRAAGGDLGRDLRAARRAAAAVPARHRVELLDVDRRARSGARGDHRRSRSTTSCASGIFEPLGMDDTGVLGAGRSARPAGDALRRAPDDDARRRGSTRCGAAALQPPARSSAAAGSCRPLGDYLRFAEMLRRERRARRVRLLAPRTVDYATQNHLPGGRRPHRVRTPAVQRDHVRRRRASA